MTPGDVRLCALFQTPVHLETCVRICPAPPDAGKSLVMENSPLGCLHVGIDRPNREVLSAFLLFVLFFLPEGGACFWLCPCITLCLVLCLLPCVSLIIVGINSVIEKWSKICVVGILFILTAENDYNRVRKESENALRFYLYPTGGFLTAVSASSCPSSTTSLHFLTSSQYTAPASLSFSQSCCIVSLSTSSP
jgi:hypothetical protein